MGEKLLLHSQYLELLMTSGLPWIWVALPLSSASCSMQSLFRPSYIPVAFSGTCLGVLCCETSWGDGEQRSIQMVLITPKFSLEKRWIWGLWNRRWFKGSCIEEQSTCLDTKADIPELSVICRELTVWRASLLSSLLLTTWVKVRWGVNCVSFRNSLRLVSYFLVP